MIRQIPVNEIKEFFIIKPHGLWHGEKLFKFGEKFDVENLSNITKQIYYARQFIGSVDQVETVAGFFGRTIPDHNDSLDVKKNERSKLK